MPLSMLITDYHFLLLYSDRVCAISNLAGDERLVCEELLALVRGDFYASGVAVPDDVPQKPSEKALFLASDPRSKTYWVYSNVSMFEIIVNDEDRDVWKVYLGREEYDRALEYAKVLSLIASRIRIY